MKIAIVGSAPSKWDAPFKDAGWTIWATSESNIDIPRWDEWFELHNHPAVWFEVNFPAFFRFLTQAERPVWMSAPSPVFPASRPFDHARLLAEYGGSFFTSSIAWMMAEALKRGAKEIGLFGVDMATDGEYADQRPGCLYFMEIAARNGVRITLPHGCALAVPPRLYGVTPVSFAEVDILKRRDTLKARLDDALQKRQSLDIQIAGLRGAVSTLNETLRLSYGVTQ